jgi:nucleoside-diphosphate-sugar epimerase
MKILTTGTAGGLGRYLYESLGGHALSRQKPIDRYRSLTDLDAIVHCAFNTHRDISVQNLYGYLQDNILLTLALTDMKHQKFIYLSSVDVYVKDQSMHVEDERIELFDHNNLYSITKLYAESIVRQRCGNHLILRLGLPLGQYTRKNNFTKILTEISPTLTLSEQSTFTCILYQDLLSFIRLAMDSDLTGTFNVVANDSISLADLAVKCRKKVRFGSFTYRCGEISNAKVIALCDRFNKTSEQVVDEYLKAWV